MNQHLLAPSRATGHPYKTIVFAAILLTFCIGCGPPDPPATVEGTLRLNGKPLDNCLVTFLPEADTKNRHFTHSSAVTDRNGHYRLQTDTQQDGAATGSHCVTIQDLSARSSTPRQDHGSPEIEKQKAALPPRPSRIKPTYLSAQTTPIRKELQQGHQIIDLDLEK